MVASNSCDLEGGGKVIDGNGSGGGEGVGANDYDVNDGNVGCRVNGRNGNVGGNGGGLTLGNNNGCLGAGTWWLFQLRLFSKGQPQK